MSDSQASALNILTPPAVLSQGNECFLLLMYSKSKRRTFRPCAQGLECYHIQMAGSLPSTFNHFSKTTPSTLVSWLLQREPLLSTSLSPKTQLLQRFAHDFSSRLLKKGSLYLNVIKSDNTVQLFGFTYFACTLCAFDVCTFALEKAQCCLHWFFFQCPAN